MAKLLGGSRLVGHFAEAHATSANNLRIAAMAIALLLAVAGLSYELVVIGGGSAGLTAAKFAATIGKSVAIVEKGRMGGDCTWTGCVPSKTLLAVAKQAHAARLAARSGYVSTGASADAVTVDMPAVKRHVMATVQKIYDEDDSPEALEKLGVETVEGAATFVDASTLRVTPNSGAEPLEVRATEGIIIATGAGPRKSNLPGLDSVKHITYEEVFDLDVLPNRMTVVGGGPIGCELAQAFSRLGSDVTIAAPSLLPGDEPEVGEAMSALFASEGIRHVADRAASVSAGGSDGGHVLSTTRGETIEGDVLLVATGRSPITGGMGIDTIGVATNAVGGIDVDEKLRTACKGVYAAGDCTGDQQFTHYAGYQGAIAARNILLPLTDTSVKASEARRDHAEIATRLRREKSAPPRGRCPRARSRRRRWRMSGSKRLRRARSTARARSLR